MKWASFSSHLPLGRRVWRGRRSYDAKILVRATGWLRSLPYLWTGCYAGGNIGEAWSNLELSTLLPVEPCRLVIVALLVAARSAVITNGAWVFGFRNMFEGTSLSSSRAFADTSTHWFDTLTARGVW